MKPGSSRSTPNRSGRVVRRHAQRTARSQHALANALGELMQERPFARITVQQVLQRAGVGRTTFYAHFQDKDDLLLSSYVRMLEAMTRALAEAPDRGRRLLPVREFFAHVGRARTMLALLEQSGRLPVLW